jgi:hypothetical protein
MKRLARGDEETVANTSATGLITWAIIVGFFDLMSVVCLLATYFSNPGFVKDYFRSRQIEANGQVMLDIDSPN